MHTVLWGTDRNSTAGTGWTPFVSAAAEVSGKVPSFSPAIGDESISTVRVSFGSKTQ